MEVRYIRRLNDVEGLSAGERDELDPVARRYAFRANDYYLGLIDWDDPADPIRRLVIPDTGELVDWGQLDASRERTVTRARGLQHKYRDTALLLVTHVCGAYCRYCFRKRLFMRHNDEASVDVSEGLAYIRDHPEITNVLLTGGDPLLLSTRRILDIVGRLRQIPHVRIIRIGTKMPAFNPWRILEDDALLDGLAAHSRPDARVFVITHFDHPRELTEPAVRGLDRLQRAGLVCVNQNPMIRGVNDQVAVLASLFARLSWIGCTPYYVFQGRPTAGNAPFEVPLVEGFRTFDRARHHVGGLARRARFAMSHASGKVVVVGLDDDHIYARYHRAKDPADEGRFLVLRRDDEACWLDQLEEVAPAASASSSGPPVMSSR